VKPGKLTVLVLLVGFALSGCGTNTNDLQDYFATVRAKPGGTIEPLPEFPAYEPFAYSAMGLRSPFDAPVRAKPRPTGPGGKEVKPDLTRPKQYLEQFNVIDLRMVGTLNRPGEFFALVREPTGGVHRVRVGDFMGQNYGRITGVGPTSIELTEIVSDGVGGWQERNRTLNLGGGGGTEDGQPAAGTEGGAPTAAGKGTENADSGEAQP
jgi:type IV pilus assembly protein PilP